jgi:spore cortex formation protein SpoVR/YcgB (stage V sporulation)
MAKKYLFESNIWTLPLVEKTLKAVLDLAKDYGLDLYKPSVEIISSTQMLEMYTSGGLPNNFTHWTFGRDFIQQQKEYLAGQSGLAYEIVINSNPCIAYLMDTNTMTMQALVLAHAAVGHNNFFKTNYLFKDNSDADSILDYTLYAKEFIQRCEDRYGSDPVEDVLDIGLLMQIYGVDKCKRSTDLTYKNVQQKIIDLKRNISTGRDPLFVDNMKQVKHLKQLQDALKHGEAKRVAQAGQENVLAFLAKYSGNRDLNEDFREILNIQCALAQYFYPQRLTKLMNEGWASFWHHRLMTDLWEAGKLTEGSYLEFLHSHTNVLYNYGGGPDNVYKLGFEMFQDIKRMCENPTEEDLKFRPEICNTDWLTTLKDIAANYRDDSFVLQFLSPKVIRDFGLFEIADDDEDFLKAVDIADTGGYNSIRKSLSEQYSWEYRIPDLQVTDVIWDGTLVLTYTPFRERGLADDVLSGGGGGALHLLEAVRMLWGGNVRIATPDGRVLLETE